MTDRQVTQTGKDRDGDITSLCGSDTSWSPRAKHLAINDIEFGTHNYYVQLAGLNKVYVRVAKRASGKYLYTTADSSDRNNLDNLPDC